MRVTHYDKLKTPTGVIMFYEDQIVKFNELGLGNFTDNGVEVTEQLIGRAKLRLNQLITKYLDNFEYEHRQ